MADPVTTQEAGGGEGTQVPLPAAVQEVKPVDPVKTEQAAAEKTEAAPEPVTEAKPEEKQANASATAVPAPEQAKENQTAVNPASVPVPEPSNENQTAVNPTVEPVIDAKPAENPLPAAVNTVEAEVKAEIKPGGAVEVAIENKDKTEVKAEVQPEVPVQTEVKNEPKPEPVKEEIKVAHIPDIQQAAATNGAAGDALQSEWQQREQALLKKIQELEEVKKERSEDALKIELKVREEEIDLLKARVKNLETELQAALSKPGAKNHEMIENIKQQHEELLSKARGMIFDKTKMVKNQELQIEALTTQVQSLKDINLITKDLLEIRNSEIKAMEDRLQAMEARFKTEKERYGLVLERAQTSSNINDDLKQEYMTQLKIFKELRTKYEQKVQALVTENEKLKQDLAKTSSGPSTEPPK